MSKAVILQHVAHEGPGRIVPIFRDFGIPIDIRHLYKGDEVPHDLDSVRMLIVLGGPMGVADIGNEKYPFLAQELELLKRAAWRWTARRWGFAWGLSCWRTRGAQGVSRT